MNVKKIITIVFICFIFLLILFSNENKIKYDVNGLDEKTIEILYGVWVKDISLAKYVRKYSWGYSKINPYLYVEFDFSKEKQFWDSNSDFMNMKIKSAKKLEKNKYHIELETDQLKEDQRILEIEILENNKINIVSKTSFFQSGIFYKIGGPDIKFDYYFTPTVNKLRLRDKPDLKENFIKYLNKGDKVVILTSLEEVIEINGTKGTWVKVETEKGEIGWCFDAYLEEVKKN